MPVTPSGSSPLTDRRLAPYALDAADTLGRRVPEAASRTRTAFARDRDRIIHSTAFRRLKEKTQVFVAHEGDHYRTRLTHSLEVAQIARSLAHALRLDTDLAEAVALAHDLGHPPFGHAGEDELQACMEPWGGFDHNVQTFRVVTRLEERYPDFLGLNLSWETLEAVIEARNTGSSARKGLSPDDAGQMKGLMAAEAGLGSMLGKFFALSESYPDLKANQNMMQLSEELTSTENKVSFSRQAYNDAVTLYNTQTETIPTNIIAGMFSFRQAVLFEITNVEERERVDVSFG